MLSQSSIVSEGFHGSKEIVLKGLNQFKTSFSNKFLIANFVANLSEVRARLLTYNCLFCQAMKVEFQTGMFFSLLVVNFSIQFSLVSDKSLLCILQYLQMFQPRQSNQVVSMKPVLRQTPSSGLSRPKVKKGETQSSQESITLKSGATNLRTQCFSFFLQQSLLPSDPTVAWTYTIPTLTPNQKQLFLVTESFTTILQDFVGDDFPQAIYISAQGVNGFIGSNTLQTSFVICLNLVDINTVNNQGTISRDLIYRNQSNMNWSMGTNRSLIFKVYLDGNPTPISFPIVNPLFLTFKIQHLSI